MRKLEGWKAVVSVPSQRKAWEVYPLEVYYPDDPTRLCRPKAGQSLVIENVLHEYNVNDGGNVNMWLCPVSFSLITNGEQ